VDIIRGIDVSDNMVASFNETARTLGLSEKMHAVQGNILETSAALGGEKWHNFDVIVMSMALHHVSDPQAMTAKLVERLRDGGSVLIIDWATESSQKSKDEVVAPRVESKDIQKELEAVQQTMIRANFGKEEMLDILREAGCNEAKFALNPEISVLPGKFGGEKRLFFAVGRK